MELKNLLDDMDVYTARQEGLLRNIEEKLKEIPYIDNLLVIKGIGMVTVSGFIAEVGDIGHDIAYKCPRGLRVCPCQCFYGFHKIIFCACGV